MRYIPVTDTVTIRDTVMVPILQKVYQSPDYRAWVSGYNAALDSIEIYPKTVTVNNFVKPRKWSLSVESMYGIKPFGVDLSAQVGYQFIPDRWGATLEAGYSFTGGGAEPFVGVGVSYRIW